MILRVADTETLAGGFLYGDIDHDTKEVRVFRIDKYRNDLSDFVNYILYAPKDYLVTFNGEAFDGPVIQYILDNWMLWGDLTSEQIVKKIYQFAQDTIDDTNNNLPPKYRPWEFNFPLMDLFRIHHYDNEARRCSLKWLEYSMDLENIEEMPIHHSVKDLTPEMIDEIVGYWNNDGLATDRLLDITLGNTHFEEYRGKNKIQDRLDIMSEFGIRGAMNFSDVKIGDELNLRGYMKETGLSRKQIKEIRKKRVPTKPFTYGDCIPSYVKFQTPQFQNFYEKVKNVQVKLGKVKKGEQEFPLTVNKTTYTVARGGIHSNEKKRIIFPLAGQILRDADVGSQYPNAIVKRRLFPSHLGPEWLIIYQATIELRLKYKAMAENMSYTEDERRKFKGVAEMLKLALNGGGFGKTNEPSNWQYDPFVQFSCTIGNQFEMLMLIERLEMEGIHVVSANTDGIVCLFDEEKEVKYKEICDWWEKTVGNDKMGKLEFTDFEKLIQTSVNSYLAVKKGGKVKKKGKIFLTSTELHKNKSMRIVPIALEKYFVDKTPIEETIQNHSNIFDFCMGVKASKDYHYEAVNNKTGDKDIYHRIVRYFVSENGKVLLKVKNEDSDSDGADIQQCEAGGWLSTVYNVAKEQNVSKLNVDYSYYIDKALDISFEIEHPGKKRVKTNKDQLSLF